MKGTEVKGFFNGKGQAVEELISLISGLFILSSLLNGGWIISLLDQLLLA